MSDMVMLDSPTPDAVHAGGPGKSICLVSALTVTDFLDAETTARARIDTGAQVGIFTLAAILRREGFRTQVLNLDDLFLEYLRAEPGRSREGDGNRGPSFRDYLTGFLRESDCDVFGFSSICSSYPLTLRLANLVRELHPEAKVLLGGPQASVVDVATLKEFPSVDFVLRGEADITLPRLLTILERADAAQLHRLNGLTFRRPDGGVIRNPNAEVVRELDSLPLPAFDLDLGIQKRGGVHIEIGRGCPFACTFCSTNDFFRRQFRLKSTATMLREMEEIANRYGIHYFSFIHDMYTVDRKRVVEFCEALLASGASYTWGCSARTDCVDDELIALMAEAGCRGMFFGIETGSQRMQEVINKKLDLEDAWQRIRTADRHGIDTAVALITGFPEETRDDLRDTIHFFVNSLRFDHAEPQLSLLAPLAGTPIFDRHQNELMLDYIFSDMSHQGWWQDEEDIELIKAHPRIFPNFYAIPTSGVSRTYFREVRDFATYVCEWFRWLPVGLLRDSGDLLRVFDRWKQWLSERQAANPVPTGRTPYYCHRQFRRDFLDFVESCYIVEMAKAPVAIATLVRMEGFSVAEAAAGAPVPIAGNAFDETAIPHIAGGHFLSDLPIAYDDIVECLRNRGSLGDLPLRKSTVAFRLTPGSKISVWQLQPMTATLLRSCDGEKSMQQIASEFQPDAEEIGGIPAQKAGMFGLMLLHGQGFITPSHERRKPASPVDEGFAAQHVIPPSGAGTQQPWPPAALRQ